jgi:serine/threonine protein kinase
VSASEASEGEPDETMAGDESLAGERARTSVLTRGRTVGRYVVIDKIGHGGMGIVYAAYDPELDRRVALKLLVSDPWGQSSGGEAHARMLREAQAMAKLTHPQLADATEDIARDCEGA